MGNFVQALIKPEEPPHVVLVHFKVSPVPKWLMKGNTTSKALCFRDVMPPELERRVETHTTTRQPDERKIKACGVQTLYYSRWGLHQKRVAPVGVLLSE